MKEAGHCYSWTTLVQLCRKLYATKKINPFRGNLVCIAYCLKQHTALTFPPTDGPEHLFLQLFYVFGQSKYSHCPHSNVVLTLRSKRPGS